MKIAVAVFVLGAGSLLASPEAASGADCTAAHEAYDTAWAHYQSMGGPGNPAADEWWDNAWNQLQRAYPECF